MKQTQNKETGDRGEELACRMLAEKGMEIVERNYRYGKGEIDIVAKDKDELVFVEVKTRKNLEYGDPEYALTKNKQAQVRKICAAYLYDRSIEDTNCRIDVVAILFRGKEEPVMRHIENAF